MTFLNQSDCPPIWNDNDAKSLSYKLDNLWSNITIFLLNGAEMVQA